MFLCKFITTSHNFNAYIPCQCMLTSSSDARLFCKNKQPIWKTSPKYI